MNDTTTGLSLIHGSWTDLLETDLISDYGFVLVRHLLSTRHRRDRSYYVQLHCTGNCYRYYLCQYTFSDTGKLVVNSHQKPFVVSDKEESGRTMHLWSLSLELANLKQPDDRFSY